MHTYQKLFLLSVVVCLFHPTPIYAADVTSVSDLDVNATGQVAGAETLKQGSIEARLSGEMTNDRIPTRTLTPSNNSNSTGDSVLSQANKMSALIGYGITNSLDLSLGLHGTYESLSSSGQTLLDKSQSDSQGFSGASLLLKWKLLDSQYFKAAIAPFVESGAGSNGKDSLMRSENADSGAMAMITTGFMNRLELSLDGGYRYRSPADIGPVRIGNEEFYGASLAGYLAHDFALFAAYEGRMLAVSSYDAQINDYDGNYQARSAATTAGLKARLGSAEFSLYGGAGLNTSSEDFGGYGSRIFGVSIAYIFGGAKSSGTPEKEKSAPTDKASPAKTPKPAPSSTPAPNLAPRTKPTAKNQPAATPDYTYAADEYPGADGKPMKLTGIDKTADIPGGPADDFNLVKQRLAREKQLKKDLKSDQLEERLKKLEADDARAAAEKARLQKEQQKIDRLEARERMQEDKERAAEMREEVRDEVRKLPSVTHEDVSFGGLDD